MPVFAFDPVGIGEFWTGLILGAVGVPVVFFAFLFLSEIEWPWQHRDYDDEFERPRSQPITHGVVICDWVDSEILASIARQRKIEPEPVRLERGASDAKGGRLEGGHRLLRGGLSRERKTDEKSFYEFTHDPNAMLSAVLADLDAEDEIRRELDIQPFTDVFNTGMLEEVFALAKDQPEAKTAREAVDALQTRTLVESKLEEFKAISEREPSFVFVENEWDVSDEDAALWLDLVKLRRPVDRGYYEERGSRYRDEPQTVNMPPELSLVAALSKDKLTDAESGRLKPKYKIQAAVFGMTGRLHDLGEAVPGPRYRMFLTPIAVFARIQT